MRSAAEAVVRSVATARRVALCDAKRWIEFISHLLQRGGSRDPPPKSRVLLPLSGSPSGGPLAPKLGHGHWSGRAGCASFGGCCDGDGDHGRPLAPRVRPAGSSGGTPAVSFVRLAAAAACASPSSAALAAFLCLNVVLMAAEATVGVLARSLTLTTDAAHMLLDCAALAVGLCGEASARAPPSARHPFGLSRVDPLCALVNGLLLLLVALSVACEALARLAHPRPLVDDSRLLPVAAAGLGINLIGLVFLPHHHLHAHGADGCGDGACAAQAAGGANMRAVVLHVAADTLGSLATIVSSLLARHLGWTLADPCCSLLVAACILAAALPLLRDASLLLLLPTPASLRGGGTRACVEAMCALPHVRDVRRARFWSHTAGRALGAVTVVVAPAANERLVALDVQRVARTYDVHAVAVECVHDEPTP
jgi:zinc transporter 5/7